MTESHQRAWNANPDIYSVIENGHCHYKDISAHCNKKSKTIRNKKERSLLSCLAISVNSNQFRHRRSQPVEPRHAPRKAPLLNLLPFPLIAPPARLLPSPRALGGEGAPHSRSGGGTPPPTQSWLTPSISTPTLQVGVRSTPSNDFHAAPFPRTTPSAFTPRPFRHAPRKAPLLIFPTPSAFTPELSRHAAAKGTPVLQTGGEPRRQNGEPKYSFNAPPASSRWDSATPNEKLRYGSSPPPARLLPGPSATPPEKLRYPLPPFSRPGNSEAPSLPLPSAGARGQILTSPPFLLK